MEKETRYFNFPIQILQGFMNDQRNTLNNICDYAIYAHSLSYEYGESEIEKFEEANGYYRLKVGNSKHSLNNGKYLYNDFMGLNPPMVGLSTNIWWDFYLNQKTDFELACLLGFLGLKSILNAKSYCKVTNNYWLSRMDGQAKSVSQTNQLTPPIAKYSNEYQLKKIKEELSLNWGLKHYGRYTRGFYVSFKMEFKELVRQAELSRKSRKKEQLKNQRNEIIQNVLIELQ
ncbi:MAG TPA: hypothetical protein PKL31_04110 [Fulvivirga sp.]|nr:hypothetical protein [Fulvivirga sp.]